MTITTSSRPAPTQIAWGPVIWICGLHLAALLALVPGTFSWSALAVCLFLHWLTGGIGICMTYHRLLTHRSFATRPKCLEYVLTAIGRAPRKEVRSAGWPTIVGIMPIPTRKTTSTARTAVSAGPTCSGG